MSITTRGHGSVAVACDTVRIHLEVEFTGDTATETVAGVQVAQEQALGVLATFVGAQQVSSAGLRLSPDYRDGRSEGFVAGHSLTVTGLATERAGDVVAALAESLGDGLRLHGLELTAHETDAAEAEARELAVRDARLRAEHLALLTGSTLGAVCAVRDIADTSDISGPSGFIANASMGRGAVAGGEQDVRQSVTVTWDVVPAQADGGQADARQSDEGQAGPTSVATSAAPSPT